MGWQCCYPINVKYMTTKFNSYEDLSSAAVDYLHKLGRSKASIRIYLWAWNRFKHFIGNQNINDYTYDAVFRYIQSSYGTCDLGALSNYQKDHLRQCWCLVQFAQNGDMPIYIYRKQKPQINSSFSPIINEYLDYKKSMRVSPITLKAHRWHLFQFSSYLHERGINSFSFVSPLELMHYATDIFPNEPAAKNQSLIVVRRFLNYLFDTGHIKRNLSLIVPKDNYRKQAKLPSVYTPDEIRLILNSIDRTTPLGKRNYAIILLAVRLGMRASDISDMKFSSIKWAANQISFIQMKTGREITLPLPVDVGESIIDYIKEARPISDNLHVFLSPRYPHKNIDSDGISHMVRAIVAKSGVNVGKRKVGPHAMRHSLATQMLNKGVSLPVISEVLGHSNIKTSMNYLRVDVESMRQCAAEVPIVPKTFYEQKGGAFYG